MLMRRELGRQPYQPVWDEMRAFTNRRSADTADELWLLEHDPVYTQGLAGRPEHVLNPGHIPLIQTDRGGQVTYHGPGQLVAYPLLDLKRLGIGIKSLVATLEQAVIDLLGNHGVRAGRHAGAPGVYVEGAKIAALGLKIRRGCCYHGLAFNIDMDLEPFSRINPCGFANLPVVQLKDFVADATVASAGREFAARLQWLLNFDQSHAA